MTYCRSVTVSKNTFWVLFTFLICCISTDKILRFGTLVLSVYFFFNGGGGVPWIIPKIFHLEAYIYWVTHRFKARFFLNKLLQVFSFWTTLSKMMVGPSIKTMVFKLSGSFYYYNFNRPKVGIVILVNQILEEGSYSYLLLFRRILAT